MASKTLTTGKTGTGLKYRDVQGSGGYTYRQYEDGSLTILKSPSGQSGRVVYSNEPAWLAITREIGPFPGTVNPKTGQKWTAQDWAVVVNAGANALSAALRDSARQGRRQRKEPELPPSPVEPVPAAPTVSPVMIAGGVGVAALLIALLVRK